MNNWIALLRGINVGGHNILPMKELKVLLEALGCRDIATYIQSGNVVFRHTESDAASLEATISDAICESFGFESRVMLLSVDEFTRCVRDNPFSQTLQAPKTLHLWFLAAPVEDPDIEKMDSLKAGTEEFMLSEKVFYLSAPDGIGRSKLAVSVEKLLGVPATARNLRTASKLCEMTSKMFPD